MSASPNFVPRIAAVEALVFRCPIATPVVTSFGIMRDRPMLLVRIEDGEGAVGWGEVWCNFPSVGAEHRARLIASVFAPVLLAHPDAEPATQFARLTEATAVLALQSGEPGPIAQCIAGIDIALWDLAARRADAPLWRHLGGVSPTIPVYASGLNPDAPERLAAARRDEGHNAFKLKVGFGPDRDRANLRALRAELGPDAALMIDANQAWSPADALAQAPALEEFSLRWLEEPLRADRPWPEWQRLAERVPMPLAAGENIAGEADFAAAIASDSLSVIQPDIAKWGGLTAGRATARAIRAAGRRFCPHWLGGGIGLLASAHLLAAAGGDGALEIDANPNALRERSCGALTCITDGHATLCEAPGLGPSPDLAALAEFRVDL